MRTSIRPVCLALALLVAAPALAQDVCDGVSTTDNLLLDSVTVATGLTQPLLITAPPGDTERIFIVEQPGRIRIKKRGDAPSTLSTFLDIQSIVNNSGDERGLLGLAFDPDYATNGYFYVYLTRVPTGDTVVARYTVSADPDVADPLTQVPMLFAAQPQSNHNGGHLAFGPDGMLYIGMGDGGGSNDTGTGHDTCGNGQFTETLLGKILRIDPHGTGGGDCGGSVSSPYGIPGDNPLVDGSGGDCDEIFAWGMRNPWRYGFDAENGDLYVADVGQFCWEEVNHREFADAAGNYGWRAKEGFACFDVNNPFNCASTASASCTGSPDCDDPSLIDPVLQYGHGGPCSITGGGAYRGCRMPNLHGYYFYGDYCAGFVRSFVPDGAGGVTTERDWTAQVAPGNSLAFDLTSFGTDARGELYIADRDGIVLKIVPPFTDLEVSGVGAADGFLLGAAGDWTWEDLEYETMVPTDFYRVYRGTPNADFECIHASLTPDWAAGDVVDPNPGELLAYVVTAVSGNDESKSGTPERTLINPCPAP